MIGVRRPYEDSLGRKGSDRFAFPPKAVASLSQTLSAVCCPATLAPWRPAILSPWRLAALLSCHRGALAPCCSAALSPWRLGALLLCCPVTVAPWRLGALLHLARPKASQCMASSLATCLQALPCSCMGTCNLIATSPIDEDIT